jgi:hypothetical protein
MYRFIINLFMLICLLPITLIAADRQAAVNTVVEWFWQADGNYADPFNEIELDVVFTGPTGRTWKVPAFWGGDREWRVRFSAPEQGSYRWRSVCSNTSDAGLHNQVGTLEVHPYTGDNPLYQHGALQVSGNKRFLEHADGAPFFWLADSWWLGMSKRFKWPDDFQLLTQDRKDKGFTVIQTAVAWPCDMAPFDERGANEAGHAWEEDFATINPAYWDLTDLRIGWLVRSGLMPNIVASWGYYMYFMDVDRMKKHWRYVIARYGAYPVTWTLAGEVAMPWYLVDWDEHRPGQIQKWKEVLAHVREIDPYQHPITAHPGPGVSFEPLSNDATLLDFTFVMSGHNGWDTIPGATRSLLSALSRSYKKPALYGEVCFEGMHGGSEAKVQRTLFWSALLSGAAGHCYGVDAIWQFNTREKPFGPSPTGVVWGNVPWEDAYQWLGSKHVGIGAKLLSEYEWWRLQPSQHLITRAAGDDDAIANYCAAIPGELWVVYFPQIIAEWRSSTLSGLDKDAQYDAKYLDPMTGDEYPIDDVTPNDVGEWTIDFSPIKKDLVLVVQKR